jgi:hypothetical protein
MAESARRGTILTVALVAFANLPVLGRGFSDLDDWTHVATGLGLVRRDPVAWSHVLSGRTGVASVRPGSALSWALDAGLFGVSPAGYFATNLLLQVALAAAVFALILRVARSPIAAVAGAVALGLSASTSQPVTYLSGRDDLLANLAFVAAVLLWQGGRDVWRGRVGVALIYGLGALCKPTILPLPALLLFDDLLRDGRGALAPRRLAARYAPLVVVGLGLLAALTGVLGTTNPGQLLTPEQRDGLAAGRGLGRFAGRVASSLLLPSFAREGGVAAAVFDLPRLLAVAAALGLAARRGPHRRLVALGAGWLGLNLLMPLPFVVMESWRAQDAGRYLQLPTIGFSMVVAAGVARASAGRRGRALGPALIAFVLLPYLMRVTPTLASSGVDTDAFVAAIRAAVDDLPPGGRVVVALRGPDHGLTSLAGSSLLEEKVPELPARPALFLEGSRRLHRNTERGPSYDYARFTALQDDFALRELDTAGADRLVAEQPGGGWARLVLDPGIFADRASSPPPPSWDFRDGSAQGWLWREVPPALRSAARRDGRTVVVEPPARAGVGLELYVQAYLPPAVLERALRVVREQPTHVLSPPVDLVPSSICGATVSLTLPDRVEPSYAEGDFLVPSRRFALLGWSESEDAAAAPFDHHVVVPLSEFAGPQSATVALDNSPGWLATGRVRRLALLPANVPGPVDLEGITLLPCE